VLIVVIEIPTSQDFAQASLVTLNLAWDIAVELSARFRAAIDYDLHDVGEIGDDYWSRAQRRLGHAVTLVHQSLELAVKSRIVGISPYLLIANDVNGFPKLRPSGIPFSEFKTLDAKDLVRVHDVYSAERMDDEWIEFFESNRRLRNQLIHGVGKADRISEIQVFSDVLRTIRLMPQLTSNWSAARLDYLKSQTAEAVVDMEHYPLADLLSELDIVTKLLPRKVLQDSLGFDKKQRRYICPGACYTDMQQSGRFASQDMVRLAQLKPNTPTSDSLACMACGTFHAVTRSGCLNKQCPSNVIGVVEDEYFKGTDDEELRVCLVCGLEQNPAPRTTISLDLDF
jgi:hypothetical protein